MGKYGAADDSLESPNTKPQPQTLNHQLAEDDLESPNPKTSTLEIYTLDPTEGAADRNPKPHPKTPNLRSPTPNSFDSQPDRGRRRAWPLLLDSASHSGARLVLDRWNCPQHSLHLTSRRRTRCGVSCARFVP